MSEPRLGSTSIPEFVVKQLNPSKYGLSETDLTTALQDVELQTQILGASFIKVFVDDPEWVIQNSGLIRVNSDGILNELEVEYPESSGYFWRLAAVEGSTEITQANLTLTFEDRIVARLREQWKHRTFPPGLSTRAQVVKALVEEANLKEHLNPRIRFISPGLNRKEPVAEATEEATQTTTAKSATSAKANKEVGPVTRSSWAESVLKAAGWPTSSDNIKALAGWATAEGGAGPQFGVANNTANYNPLNTTQSEPGAASTGVQGNIKSYTSWAQGVEATITTLKNGSYANIIKSLEAGNDAAAVAKAVGESPWGTAAGLVESAVAAATVESGGETISGVTIPGAKSSESDVGQLSRGTPQNPDEDSWDCIQRLAAEVNWSAFTDGKNTLFYMDGPDLIHQTPVLYIDVSRNHIVKVDGHGHKTGEEYGALLRPLSYTYDNTAFLYRATHKVKGKLQRKSRIARPQTPSEVRLKLVCGITEYRAGDVFVFRNSGPLSENGGRWIVSDATRKSMEDPFTQFILVPPTEPLPEPAANGTVARENPNSAAGQAEKALGEKGKYRYVYGAGHAAGTELFGQEPREMDCSAFAGLCYREAGLKIPGQSSAGYIPGTQEMIEAMKKTSNPQPGALAFFGTLTHTTHVNVVVGGGKSISMGKEGDPSEGPTAEMGPSGYLGTWEPK